METDALRWFQQVADGVTVTEVGASEFVTQSAISRALARLETEVGSPLLRRTGRVLRLTQAGTAFKRHVDALLHQLDDGLAAVDQLVDPERGTVGIAFQLSLGTWLVPSLVGTFRATHPHVRFELQQVRDELPSSVLAEDRLDLEITTVRPADRTVSWHRLLLEPLVLAVPAGSPLATRSETPLAEAAEQPFITLRPASLLRQKSETLCQQAGFQPRSAFAGEDVPTLRGFVGAGLGVAIVPAPRAGSPDASSTTIRHVRITDAGAFREIGLGTPSDQPILPAAELFRQHVVDRVDAGALPALAGFRH